jgi:hypothetical protein
MQVKPITDIQRSGVAGTFSSTSGLICKYKYRSDRFISKQPGTYTVTNTIAAAGGCAAVVATSLLR